MSFPLSLSHTCTGALTTVQCVHDMGYYKRMNAEADMIIHLISMKPNIKEICKSVKECNWSHKIVFENVFFIKHVIYINLLMLVV